ncbi:MAG TPA: hypothetical protein VGM25_12505 [Caulobacteraceae bacterium]|jgi:hypothetical protein
MAAKAKTKAKGKRKAQARTKTRDRQLKAYWAEIDGLHDWVVAAPNRAAALEAFGVRQNLFAQGEAGEASDPAAIEAARAQPLTPLRRPKGSSEPFAAATGAADWSAAIPKGAPKPKKPKESRGRSDARAWTEAGSATRRPGRGRTRGDRRPPPGRPEAPGRGPRPPRRPAGPRRGGLRHGDRRRPACAGGGRTGVPRRRRLSRTADATGR